MTNKSQSQSTIYQLDDVFNEAQIPTVTFVEPLLFADLVGAVRTKGKHITLSGPSGCGKTTMAKKALAKAKLDEGDYLWESGRDHAKCESVSELIQSIFACGEVESDQVGWLQVAGMLVIDDFHHLHENVKQEIGKLLKRWHERGVRIFIIGIARSAQELVSLDSELSTRNESFEMKSQRPEFIKNVIEEGERALNIVFDEKCKATYIDAANGAPSAIHTICRVACQRSDIYETCEDNAVVVQKLDSIKDGVIRTYKTKYYHKVLGLCKGKRRARSVHNMYYKIFKTIALAGETELDVDNIRKRIISDQLAKDEKAKLNTSFRNCMRNLSDVIAMKDLGDAIYYDSASEVISIEDPSFGFYLTLIDLEDIEKQIKVRDTAFPYDVAISFAGERREDAVGLKEAIESLGYAVYYDFDHQHQLWGTNLRVNLGEVFANDAQFMIVLLSKEYPEKNWTSFELDIAKNAQDGRDREYILPVITDDTVIVGLSSDVGHMDLRQRTHDDIAAVFADKIEASGYD